MIGWITPELKSRILERVDLVALIGRRLKLRPVGANYQALCPFHVEKTASFHVSPTRQTYHCFGCNAHGNAIDFLIEYDRLSFPEAIEELAQLAGVELPLAHQAAAPAPDLAPLYQVLEQAAALYYQQVRQPQAVAYLRQRGLTGEMALAFGIGYAPPGWNFLLEQLGNSPQQRQLLIDAGLVVERDQHTYDRFRDRIMFPIRNRRGQVVAFGGRVLGNDEPKYLNSPQTPVFHKGQALYGLFEAQRHNRYLQRIVVVEGYLDVIALAQFGVPYAVATLGTATTAEHIKLLQRVAGEIVFCFDGDQAGQQAAWKALRTALPVTDSKHPLRFLLLPEKQDPDSVVRSEGGAAFVERVEQAQLLSDFLFDQLTARYPPTSTEHQARLSAEARKLIDQIPDLEYQRFLHQRLAKLLELDEPFATKPRPPTPQPINTHLNPPQRIIALLLSQPPLAAALLDQPATWRTLDQPDIPLLADLLSVIADNPEMTTAQLVEYWRHQPAADRMRRLANPALIAHIPASGRDSECLGALQALNREAEKLQRWQRLRSATPEQLFNKN